MVLTKNLILKYKALLVLVDGPPARSEIYTLANNQGAQAAPHTHRRALLPGETGNGYST